MQKILTILAGLFVWSAALYAQDSSRVSTPASDTAAVVQESRHAVSYIGGHNAWVFSLQGGPLYSVNENRFTYPENGCGFKLFTLQAAAAVGYEFSDTFGLRASFSFGGNRSAANSRESGGGFYPYNFKSLNGFIDVILDLNGNYEGQGTFHPKLYVGLGGAYTYGFTKPAGYGIQPAAGESWKFHPWQDAFITERNFVPGFRGGFIAEYEINDWLGIFADLSGEAYRDDYNGLQPTSSDHGDSKGYAGFPLDLRASLSFGVIFRINNN